jgi:hypothetical protein
MSSCSLRFLSASLKREFLPAAARLVEYWISVQMQ